MSFAVLVKNPILIRIIFLYIYIYLATGRNILAFGFNVIQFNLKSSNLCCFEFETQTKCLVTHTLAWIAVGNTSNRLFISWLWHKCADCVLF